MNFRVRSMIWLVVLIPVILSSCVSNKKYVYLQDKGKNQATHLEAAVEHYRIQPNDILHITIRSMDEKANQVFNVSNIGFGANTGVLSDMTFFLNGYTVDKNGAIDLPVIGKLPVAGLTLPEIKVVVEKAVTRYFSDSYVNVKQAGINYSILGEVIRPGRYTLYQNHVNIFEAVAQAGDLNVVANRRQVKILRQHVDGPKIHAIDLTDRNIITSPYFYLQPNDIVYVEPLKVRSLGTGTTGFSSFQAILSVLTLTTLVLNIFKK
jgi:polysaccharide biosynthesis/export protein